MAYKDSIHDWLPPQLSKCQPEASAPEWMAKENCLNSGNQLVLSCGILDTKGTSSQYQGWNTFWH